MKNRESCLSFVSSWQMNKAVLLKAKFAQEMVIGNYNFKKKIQFIIVNIFEKLSCVFLCIYIYNIYCKLYNNLVYNACRVIRVTRKMVIYLVRFPLEFVRGRIRVP